MRIDGSWLVCEDYVTRPVIRADVLTDGGSWEPTNFLLDTGADRMVFNAKLLALLPAEGSPASGTLEGVGGQAESVFVETQMRFMKEDRGYVAIRSRFAAFTASESLAMSVSGRDITNLFAVLIDRPRDVVCLLSQRHSYTIVET